MLCHRLLALSSFRTTLTVKHNIMYVFPADLQNLKIEFALVLLRAKVVTSRRSRLNLRAWVLRGILEEWWMDEQVAVAEACAAHTKRLRIIKHDSRPRMQG